MQFEVNDQMFFLNFVPDEGRWFVFAPTALGVVRMPVDVDEPFLRHFRLPTGR